MAIPFIIAGAAIAAAAFGGKKAYDGYQTKSEADDILESSKRRYDEKKEVLESINVSTTTELEKLGTLELKIGKSFNKFNTIAQSILKQLNESGQDISISIPRHEINKIENLAISATEYLGTLVEPVHQVLLRGLLSMVVLWHSRLHLQEHQLQRFQARLLIMRQWRLSVVVL